MIGSTDTLCCILAVTHHNADKQPPSPDGKSCSPPPLSIKDLRFQVNGVNFPLDSDGMGELQLTSETKVAVRFHPPNTTPFEFTPVSPKKITALFNQAKGRLGTIRMQVTSKAEAYGFVRRKIVEIALAFSPKKNTSEEQPALTLNNSAAWNLFSWISGSWLGLTNSTHKIKTLNT